MLTQFLQLFLFLALFIFSAYLPAFAEHSHDLPVKALDAYEEKNFEIAASCFESYYPSSGLLRDYVLFWWGSSLKATGRENEAIELYNKISDTSPVRKRAAEDMIVLYRKKGDWTTALSLAKERILLEINKKLEPVLQKEAVELGYLSGDPKLSIDNFKTLIENFSASKEAIDVLNEYGHFYSFKGDELLRAKVYLCHKDFKKALESLKDRIDREALRTKAEAYYGLRDYENAISILERLVKEDGRDGLTLRLGEIYLSGHEEEKGIAILEKLAVENKGSDIACLSLWDLLNYWKTKNDEEKIKIYCKRLREGYRQFSLTDKAIWIEGWMDMTKKNYIEADNIWKAFDSIPRKSRQKLSALYLRAWINGSSNTKESGDILKRIASLFPDTYYGLEALKKGSFKPSVKEPDLKLGELPEENDFDRAQLLLKLARYEEVILELEGFKKKRYNDINLRYNLSIAYGRANRFNESINEAESLVDFCEETGRWPGFLHLSDRKLIEINFPRCYRDDVKKRAREFKLDENLIYAVMREESRFNEEDVSCSGAIGLMQIIPSTGKWIAEKVCSAPGQCGLDLKNIAEKDFFKPEINIFMGSWYLRYLLDRFNGDLLLAVAAYNGGPGLIERWVETGGMANRDIAIEMMPKEETKYYCQKVLFSYNMYKMLYGKN